MIRPILCALALVLSVAAPVAAGTVYLPLNTSDTFNGVEYETVLKVTNTAAEPRFFTAHFIPAFTDGADRPKELDLAPIGVLGEHTFIYRNLFSGGGKTGMLEISGDDALEFNAVLVPKSGGTTGTGGPIPLVGSQNVVPGGQRIVIQGLRRDEDSVSSYGLINVSHSSNQCSLDVIAADGTELFNTVVTTLEPLSQAFFHDVLASIGIPTVSDARIEAMCPQEAYAFGQVVNVSDLTITPLRDSIDLSSTLRPPGFLPDCPTTSFCFDLPGAFHTASPGHGTYELNVPLKSGSRFKRLDVDLTVKVARWNSAQPDGIHNFFWMFSDNRFASVTWAYVNARGPGKAKVTNTHNIGLGKAINGIPQNAGVKVDHLLQAGQTYRVHYTYDTAQKFILTTFYDLNGNKVVEFADSPTRGAQSIFFEGDKGFTIWFGIPHAEYFEVPSFGWEYQDFRLELSN